VLIRVLLLSIKLCVEVNIFVSYMEIDMTTPAHEETEQCQDEDDYPDPDTMMEEESPYEEGFFQNLLSEIQTDTQTTGEDASVEAPEPGEGTSQNTEDTVRLEGQEGSGGMGPDEDYASDETTPVSVESGRSQHSQDYGEVRSGELPPKETSDVDERKNVVPEHVVTPQQENPHSASRVPDDTTSGGGTRSDIMQDLPEVHNGQIAQPGMVGPEIRDIRNGQSMSSTMTPFITQSAPQKSWVILDVQPFDPTTNGDAGSQSDEVIGPDDPSDMHQDSKPHDHDVLLIPRVRKDLVDKLMELTLPRIKPSKTAGRKVVECCMIALRKAPEGGLRLQELAYLATQTLKESGNISGCVYDDDTLAKIVQSYVCLENLQKCCMPHERVCESQTDFVGKFAVSLCIRRDNSAGRIM